MTTENTSNWLNSKNIFIALLGVATMYFFVTSLVDSRFAEVQLATRIQIENQETLLTAIAETTARNGADKITESIVRDCPLAERVRFDTLLGELNSNLPHTELVELERLFGRCGGFSSERKSVMVARLSREIEVFEIYVNQLGLLMNEDMTEKFSVPQWKNLAAEEQNQSEAFSQLARLQDQIITTLVEGNSTDSQEINTILQEVRETKEALLLANTRAAEIRSRLTSL